MDSDWSGAPGGDGRPVQDALPGLVAYSRQAPLPESAELQGYENVLKGLAHRIVRMAEKAADARDAALTRLTRAEAWAVAITAISFAITPLALTAATIIAVLRGSDTAAVVTGIAAALSAAPKVIAAIRGERDDSPGTLDDDDE